MGCQFASSVYSSVWNKKLNYNGGRHFSTLNSVEWVTENFVGFFRLDEWVEGIVCVYTVTGDTL